jgi:hypothetical protein
LLLSFSWQTEPKVLIEEVGRGTTLSELTEDFIYHQSEGFQILQSCFPMLLGLGEELRTPARTTKDSRFSTQCSHHYALKGHYQKTNNYFNVNTEVSIFSFRVLLMLSIWNQLTHFLLPKPFTQVV